MQELKVQIYHMPAANKLIQIVQCNVVFYKKV